MSDTPKLTSAETEQRLAELRAVGQTRKLTDAEAAEVVAMVRQDRISASYAAGKSKTSAAGVKKPDGAAVLAGLKALMEKKT